MRRNHILRGTPVCEARAVATVRGVSVDVFEITLIPGELGRLDVVLLVEVQNFFKGDEVMFSRNCCFKLRESVELADAGLVLNERIDSVGKIAAITFNRVAQPVHVTLVGFELSKRHSAFGVRLAGAAEVQTGNTRISVAVAPNHIVFAVAGDVNKVRGNSANLGDFVAEGDKGGASDFGVSHSIYPFDLFYE